MVRFLKLTSIIIIAASWLLFVLSFFLPSTNVLETAGTLDGTPLTGWQAFTTSLSAAMYPPLWIVEPSVFLFLSFPFANALMLLAPLLTFMLRENSAVLALMFVPCAIVPWFMPESLMGDLFAGFYCWNGSFLGMSLGCIIAYLAFAAAENDCYNLDGIFARSRSRTDSRT